MIIRLFTSLNEFIQINAKGKFRGNTKFSVTSFRPECPAASCLISRDSLLFTVRFARGLHRFSCCQSSSSFSLRKSIAIRIISYYNDFICEFQLLIKHRATVIDAQSYDGSTPLMDACRFEVNSMVEDLITTGAKVNMVDNQGIVNHLF